MPIPVGDPRTLLGRWSLDRLIQDRYAGQDLRVIGTTELTLEQDGRIRWFDAGTLRRGNTTTPVQRTSYLVRDGADWQVTFEDGSPFHPWQPGNDVEHPCAADLYRGRVDLSVVERGHWYVLWTVSGPEKDYSMTSEMTRL